MYSSRLIRANDRPFTADVIHELGAGSTQKWHIIPPLIFVVFHDETLYGYSETLLNEVANDTRVVVFFNFRESAYLPSTLTS